jgi:hypothetical protein
MPLENQPRRTTGIFGVWRADSLLCPGHVTFGRFSSLEGSLDNLQIVEGGFDLIRRHDTSSNPSSTSGRCRGTAPKGAVEVSANGNDNQDHDSERADEPASAANKHTQKEHLALSFQP